MSRSLRAEVRNPLLALPSAAGISKLPDEAKRALRDLYRDMRADAKLRADDCWRRNKGPMALYWKWVSVQAGHISRLAR